EPDADKQHPIPIEAGDLREFATKLVRGMTWVDTTRLITPEYEISLHLPSETEAAEMVARMPGAKTQIWGSALRYTAGRALEDPVIAGLVFTIWGRLRIAATVDLAARQ